MLKAVIFDIDGVIIDRESLPKEDTQKTRMQQIRLVPGVISFIKMLHKDGIRIVGISSISSKQIEEITHFLGLTPYFASIISDTKLINLKPVPDIFFKTLQVLSLHTNEVILITDSQNGCLAAKMAKIACVGYMHPNSDTQDIYSAALAIDSFESIDTPYLNEVCLRANGEAVTIAKTRRLLLKELTSNDSTTFLQLFQDKDVSYYMNFITNDLDIEIEKLNAYFQDIYSFYGYGLWGIFLKEENLLIGCCGIQNQVIDGNQEFELSYMLGKSYWGKGYALEACRSVLRIATSRFEINRLVSIIDIKNERSIHLALKLGMTAERNITFRTRSCYLYSLQLNKNRFLEARNQVRKDYMSSPDTSVYSRRFSHRTNDFHS
ncbi:MAG: GNAT family N-acetyltransferase [Velocimicrobium sp.]